MIIACLIGLAIGGGLVSVCGEIVKEWAIDFLNRAHK